MFPTIRYWALFVGVDTKESQGLSERRKAPKLAHGFAFFFHNCETLKTRLPHLSSKFFVVYKYSHSLTTPANNYDVFVHRFLGTLLGHAGHVMH